RRADPPLLAVFLELPVARGDIVADRVAEDMLRGPRSGDVPAALADDDDQLRLVVHFLADRRQHDGLLGSDDGRRVFAKENRLFRNWPPAFCLGIAIVKPESNYRGRIRHGDARCRLPSAMRAT